MAPLHTLLRGIARRDEGDGQSPSVAARLVAGGGAILLSLAREEERCDIAVE